MNPLQMSRCIFCTTIIIAIMPLVSAMFYLTIIHQNDIHGHFATVTSSGHDCIHEEEEKGECYGSFSRAVHLVKDRIKNDKYSKNLLIVNAGDFFKGSVYYWVAKWRVVFDVVRHMPYSALALGDADFADNIQGLYPFMQNMGEKFVCTNIDFSRISNTTKREDLRRLCPRHRIVSYQNGTKLVCLLGYTTPTAATQMTHGTIDFEKEEEALIREIQLVRNNTPDVKIFVALGHSGYERDKEIAYQVPSLDVIVGGHSHTLLWPNIRNKMVAGVPPDKNDQPFAKDVYPTTVIQPSGRKVLIVQMFKHGKYLGVLNVTFNSDDEVVDFFTSPVLLTANMTADKKTKEALDGYRNWLHYLPQVKIGSTRVQIEGSPHSCYDKECNLGNLAADAMVWYIQYKGTKAPRTLVGIINSGAITGAMERGQVIKVGDLNEIFLNPDTVQIVQLLGHTIRKMLEHSLKKLPNKNFLQMSGMRVRYNISKPEGQRVVSVRLLCNDCAAPRFEPLDDSASYNVAMPSYIAAGNGGFTMVKQEMLSTQQQHDSIMAVVAEYTQNNNPLYPCIEGRIEIVSARTDNSAAFSAHRQQGRWMMMAAAAAAAAAAGGLVLPLVLLML